MPPYIKGNELKISLESFPYIDGISVKEQSIALQHYIENQLKENGKVYAYGGYGENRLLYQNSNLFTGNEPRSVHLGLDFWVPENLPIILPIDGEIHSFRENDAEGDYGPTIITSHKLNNNHFYFLFGHLSKKSLEGLSVGAEMKQGETIGETGRMSENGTWPPHLHFQIILDPGSNWGDYPGVAKKSEEYQWLQNCPNPEIIFNL